MRTQTELFELHLMRVIVHGIHVRISGKKKKRKKAIISTTTIIYDAIPRHRNIEQSAKIFFIK